MAYIVVLMGRVISDLSNFMKLYIVTIFMFSMIFGVMGFQNYSLLEDEGVPFADLSDTDKGKFPSIEFKNISKFS